MEGLGLISDDSSSSISEPLVVYGTGLFVTVLAGFYFYITGYPHVVTATEILDIISPPIYMIPIFLPFGILLGELLWNFMEETRLKLCILFLVECSIIAAVSFIRFTMSIPFSGHAIILFFYLPHQLFTNNHQYPYRILCGLLVLTITTFHKIFLWHDPITFFLGIVLGIAVWFSGFVLRSKYNE